MRRCAAPEDLQFTFKALMGAADQLDTVETFPSVRNKAETSLGKFRNRGWVRMQGCLQVICSQGGRRRRRPKCFKMGAERNR